MKVRPLKPLDVARAFKCDEMFFSTTDAKGIILSGNDVFVRVSGFSAEEFRQIDSFASFAGGLQTKAMAVLDSAEDFKLHALNVNMRTKLCLLILLAGMARSLAAESDLSTLAAANNSFSFKLLKKVSAHRIS